MTPLLLGVDGGATKTVALIADPSGQVLGAGRSGSSDIHNEASPELAVDSVVACVQEAAATAGVDPADLAAPVFGLCGADWPEDVDYYARALTEHLALGQRPAVKNDAFNTLRAGRSDGIGVALVLGTGAAVAARGPDGDTWFTGERIEASGAGELGRRAFELIIGGEYGAGPEPGFRHAAMDLYGVSSVEAMIHAITRVGAPGRSSLGRLAPVLLEASHTGDPLAQDIIREHGRLLAGYVRRAAKRAGLGDAGTSVVLAGGVIKHRCRDLRDAVAAALPEYSIESARLEPVHGALLMAADRYGVEPDVEVLRTTSPGPSFFDTSQEEAGL